jgi:ABC-type phosphate transport system substrate-binding protein
MNESIERRHRRIKLIRGRVVAGAVALFVALFGGITAQLASGHDPALAKQSTTKQPTPSTTTTTTSTSSTLAPVTTKQS